MKYPVELSYDNDRITVMATVERYLGLPFHVSKLDVYYNVLDGLVSDYLILNTILTKDDRDYIEEKVMEKFNEEMGEDNYMRPDPDIAYDLAKQDGEL